MTNKEIETIIMAARLVGIPVVIANGGPMLVLPDTSQVRGVVEKLKAQGLT